MYDIKTGNDDKHTHRGNTANDVIMRIHGWKVDIQQLEY